MAPTLNPRKLDGTKPNTDALGIVYVIMAIVYTIILAAELCLLYRRRSAFCVRIRNIKVVFAAVSLLHVYLVLVLLVYPWNGLFPCTAEFWIMSVFLPSGMAFFQACNAKVLTAYESQRRLRRNFLEGARKKRVSYTPRGLYDAWRGLDAARKVYLGTLIGWIVTLIPAVILFFGSRRFHASYGFFEVPSNYFTCRRGFEWIPSILIQLFWTVVVGPWILWKIRHIKDVHAWAWQTRLAIIAGLPGTPLWIAFTYSQLPEISHINDYFTPAGWFIPSLVVCQQVLILIPLRDALKSQPNQRTMLTSETESLTSTQSSVSSKSSAVVFSKELKSKASMQALEFSIEHSIEPLIAWAASREFTAENTVFLREVRNFKKKWSALKVVTTAQRRQMFNEASLIFFTLVNPFTAETPINIEYKIFKNLQSTFSGIEFDPYMPRSQTPDDIRSPVARENVVCPWEDTFSRPASIVSNQTASSASSTRSIVPSYFTEEVFDAAFESIKYLVFTNTWPRYVDAELGGKAASP
ncbi:Nn.00g008460.m01.CDS01 [Neocucurbitaria sp. VM-36]